MKLDYANNIIKAADAIDSNIKALSKTNVNLCASNMMANIRNLLDGILELEFSKSPSFNSDDDELKILRNAKNYCKGIVDFNQINSFYSFVDIVSSHLTQDDFSSVMLIDKYENYFYETRELCKKRFGIDVLHNLDLFPFDEMGYERKTFYDSISESFTKEKTFLEDKSLFYIEKRKRIRTKNGHYFEYVLSTVTDEQSKYDRLTVYCEKNIDTYHSINCTLAYNKIKIGNFFVKVFYITEYNIEIMPREFNKFIKLCGAKTLIKTTSIGYRPLMNYLTKAKCSIYDIAFSPSLDKTLKIIFGDVSNHFTGFFRYVRSILEKTSLVGNKTLRYVLYIFKFSLMRSVEVRSVYDNFLNEKYPWLSNSCYPFEQNPFCYSLRNTNPSLYDLLMCLGEYCTKESLLKRRVKNSIEHDRELYSKISNYGVDEDVLKLVESHNNNLSQYFQSKNEEIINVFDKYLTIKSYEENVAFILNFLKKLFSIPDYNYLVKANPYILSITPAIIDENKIEFLKRGFSYTSVLIINGAAGTGKTTLVKHFISILGGSKFLLTAFTHSALQNLKRRVGDAVNKDNAIFLTLDYAQYLKDISTYDCLIIDECSTAPNELVKILLSRGTFKHVILVGDETQIQSIKFGNWFYLAITQFPTICSNLSLVHRSSSKNLKYLWNLTRNIDQNLFERMINYPFLINEISNIFTDGRDNDEIVLCLNYDGPFGVNNINRYMQDRNPETAVSWNVWTFKKNDPVIFNGCSKYSLYFYNNQKGRIADIVSKGNDVTVVVGVEASANNIKYSNDSVKYIKCENGLDYYEFTILKSISRDEDNTNKNIVPFQLSYAVSIHKSQGLEYDSVKIVLTDEVDDIISHSIFYTAITRAKTSLKLYTYRESLLHIVENFKKNDFSKDLNLLKVRKKIN